LVFICFLLLGTFPGWHQETDESGSEVEVKPFPSRRVSHAAAMTLVPGLMLAFISVLWQHINASAAASMVETFSYGGVSGHVGPAAMVLAWVAIFLISFVAIGLIVMIISIRLIKQLTDDE